MAILKEIGQSALDLFYQNYKATSQFWEVEDATYFAGIAYAEFLGQEYMLVYKSMRQDGEENNITFSHDWLQTQTLNIQRDEDGYFVQLIQQPMSFPYDKRDVGIQNIFPANAAYKCEIIRSSINEAWQQNFMPNTSLVFWMLLEDKIRFQGSLKQPPPILNVIYVPSVNPDMVIPNSREKAMIDATVQLMLTAKNQVVIKTINDQNGIAIPQIEADKEAMKA